MRENRGPKIKIFKEDVGHACGTAVWQLGEKAV